MDNHDMIWFGRYEGWLRHLSRGVKRKDRQCIRKAAQLFDMMLPDHCVVVPMAGHTGMADAMLEVANAMPSGRRFLMDTLTCEPHESSEEQKRNGFAPREFYMKFDDRALCMASNEDLHGGIYVIDNVICTGVTASAARRAIERHGLEARVCALAYSVWR